MAASFSRVFLSLQNWKKQKWGSRQNCTVEANSSWKTMAGFFLSFQILAA
jgi:hypothetical protein